MALPYRHNPNIQNNIEARHRSAREDQLGIGYLDSSDESIKEEPPPLYRNLHPEAIVKSIEIPPHRTRSESPQKKTGKSEKQRAGSMSLQRTTFWIKTPSPIPWFANIASRPAPNNIHAYKISHPIRLQAQRAPPASHYAILNPASPAPALAPYTLPELAREQKDYFERTISEKEQKLKPIPTEGYPLNRHILEREGELMETVEVESFDEHPPIVPEWVSWLAEARDSEI